MKRDTIVCADVFDFTRSLPDNSVDCLVTSIPYWNQRDYNIGVWVGGNSSCDHVAGQMRRGLGLANSPASTRGGAKKIAQIPNIQFKHTCRKCGATRESLQLGLEPTPVEYIARFVELFREIRRILRKDGTVWLNIGDSYSSGGRGSSSHHQQKIGAKTAQAQALGPKHPPVGIKEKQLLMIPARLAIALQDDGWYLRSDIIWYKPNAMPESVTDRPTTAHEHVFLLSKSLKYFYDHDAIREPQTGNTHSRGRGTSPKEIPQHDGRIRSNHSFNSSMTAYTEVPGGRNKRSVWTVATEQNSLAHFATFPQALIRPMILAGCPEGGIVFDPFMGSGTTALVARSLGRHYIGCDLNPEYVKMAQWRLRQPLTQPIEDRTSQESLKELPLFRNNA